MTEQNPITGLCHNAKHTDEEKTLVGNLSAAFNSSTLPLPLKVQHFARHVIPFPKTHATMAQLRSI